MVSVLGFHGGKHHQYFRGSTSDHGVIVLRQRPSGPAADFFNTLVCQLTEPIFKIACAGSFLKTVPHFLFQNRFHYTFSHFDFACLLHKVPIFVKSRNFCKSVVNYTFSNQMKKVSKMKKIVKPGKYDRNKDL